MVTASSNPTRFKPKIIINSAVQNYLICLFLTL